MRLLLIPVLALLLAGCDFNSKNMSSDQRDQDERQDKIEELQSIQGTYHGTVTVPCSAEDEVGCEPEVQLVVLTLTWEEKIIGNNPDGQPIYRPFLRARFARPERLVSDIEMEGDYIRASGLLTLSTKAAVGNDGKPLPVTNNFTLRGTLRSGNLDTNLMFNGFKYGDFSVRFHDGAVPSDRESRNREVEKFRRAYRPLVGVYEGTFKPDDPKHHTYQPYFVVGLQEEIGKFPSLYVSVRLTPDMRLVIASMTYNPDVSYPKNKEIRFTADGVSLTGFYKGGDENGMGGEIWGRLNYRIMPGFLKIKKVRGSQE